MTVESPARCRDAPLTVDDVVALGAMEIVDDLRPAQWLTERVRSFGDNVGSLVPATYQAYARLFHPAFAGGKPVRWAEIAGANHRIAHPQMQFTRLTGYASRYDPGYRARQIGVFDDAPEVGRLDPDLAMSLVDSLASHTATADRCWFAVWHGWGDLDRAFDRQPTFPLPGREYHLASGPLAAAAQSVGDSTFLHRSANLWWPDDHSWCVATEIDLDSTYVGASKACVEELLANPALETARVSLSAGITADSDPLNPVDGSRT